MVSDVLFTEYKCMEEHPVFKIWSHLNCFIFVISGKKEFITIHDRYEVHANEAVFLKKGGNIVHKFFDTDFCALMIFLPDDYIRRVVQENKINSTHHKRSINNVVPVQMDDSLLVYFQSLFTYFSKPTPPDKNLIELKLKELLLNLICSEKNHQLCDYFQEIFQHTKPSIHQVMEANFIYNLSLTDFAQLACRSLSTFKRDFKKEYGMAPSKWVTKRRLDYSRQLLLSSSRKISEIAFDTGFENPSHFTRIFKKHYHQSPTAYRERYTS